MDLSHNPVATLSFECDIFLSAATASVFSSSTDCCEIFNLFYEEYNVPIPRNLSLLPPPPHLCASLLPTSSSQSCILWTLRLVWVKYLWPIHLPLLFNITTCCLFSQPSLPTRVTLLAVIALANDASGLHNPCPQWQMNLQMSPNMLPLLGPAEKLG